ncbi:hypothetical protein L1987_51985 [Smallanthus sonchifolius]|uniref:Uncharacterized protein n=1 Tax=Smallanthus sonchifolius TaxID=185202 RepID=A0ACB9ERX3_9ASTR|nr:hypothetical protein L1987_51985 [Smallanthus sonchifolius]
MATGKPFREVELPQQKSQDDGVLFPAVLSPNTSTDSTATELSAFEDAIKAHKPWLESLLRKSGAVLFRGFPVISPFDFNRVVEAFGFPELLYVGGGALRTQVVDRVYTANESPLDKEIPFHHEMTYGRKLEWMGNTAKNITNSLPAISFDEESGKKTWFNSLATSYSGPASERFGPRDTLVELGNGDPVENLGRRMCCNTLEEG